MCRNEQAADDAAWLQLLVRPAGPDVSAATLAGPSSRAAAPPWPQRLALPSVVHKYIDSGSGRLQWHRVGPQCVAPFLFAAVCILGMMLAAAAYFRRICRNVEETTLSVAIVQMFMQHLSFTLIVPTSYALSAAMGRGVGYSGELIGAYMTGQCIGGVLVWFCFDRMPGLVRHGRALLLFAALCNFLGAAVYCGLSFLADSHNIPAVPMWKASTILMASRMMDGFGTAFTAQLSFVGTTRWIPSSERTSWIVSLQFSVMMGIGLGPMISSLIIKFDLCGKGSEHFGAVGIAYVGIALASAGMVALLCPSADLNVVAEPAESGLLPEPFEHSRSATSGNIVLVCACLVMTALRGFVISGLEAATALLLETDYGWDKGAIGFAIGVSFLGCVPVKLVYGAVRHQLADESWAKVFAILAISGSFLLFTRSCKILGGFGFRSVDCGIVVLLSDAILFPTLYIGDAVVFGFVTMSQHLLPSGWLDVNRVILYRHILVTGLGRALGPLLARVQADGGQNNFAWQQVSLAVVFFALLEIFVTPNIKPPLA